MRLLDNNDWGLTAIQYAHREKLKLRERNKKRMERARIVAPPIVCELPEIGQPYQTASGHMAYQKYVPNRIALGLPMTAKGEGSWISLPFLSILARDTSLESARKPA